MRRRLGALDGDEARLRVRPDLRGGACRALGQQVAQPPAAEGRRLQRGEHGVRVAPAQRQPVGVGVGEDAVLVTLDGPGDGGAGADGVQPVIIAESVGLGDGGEVAHVAVGAEGGDGLVFGAAQLALHRELAFAFDFALAAHHAGVAGVAADQDRLRQPLAGDFLGVFEVPTPVISCRQAAGELLAEHHAGGAKLAQLLHAAVGLELGGAQGGYRLDALGVGVGGALRAAHGNRLEVLGAHDRAQSGTAGGSISHIDDGGGAHQVLTGGPAAGHFDLAVAQILAQACLRIPRAQAPQVRRVAQLGLAVLDPQVDGVRRLAQEDDAVKAGVLQLGREEAAGL